eukprot:scaffold22777_cov67-Phaeocystis_antarctica.AAC.1
MAPNRPLPRLSIVKLARSGRRGRCIAASRIARPGRSRCTKNCTAGRHRPYTQGPHSSARQGQRRGFCRKPATPRSRKR